VSLAGGATGQAQASLPKGAQPLAERLASGVLPAVGRGRWSAWQGRDQAKHRKEVAHSDRAALAGDRRLWELLQPLDEAHKAQFMTGPQVEAELARISEHLGACRESLLAVLFSPDGLLEMLPHAIGDPQADVVEAWLRLCWIAEAAWSCIEDGDDTALVASDQALLLPLAARLRFLVLSEPLRYRGQSDSPWLLTELTAVYGQHGLLGQVFGRECWHVLVGRCREARWRWQQILSEHQSHPLLAQASPKELEGELAMLLFARRWEPLVVSWVALAEPVPASAAAAAVVAETVEGHLLPRFNLIAVARLAADGRDRAERVGRLTAAGGVAAAAVLAVGLAAAGHFAAAAWAAGASYALLVTGVVRFGRLWAAQWLLRLPAAAAVGLLVLVSLPPAWWRQPRVSWTPALLAVVACGYLVVEARNHGVGAGAAVVRALGVTAAGALHALLICLVGLVLVAPSYVDDGARLARLWRDGSLARPWAILALAGAWCLAVGVFSQILWDDRPITAPLAHLQWRKGR
jgi:hypothetical protein